MSTEYQVSEGAPMLPPKVGSKKNTKATTSQGESVYEVNDRRTSIGIPREVHACGDATRRVKKLGQRRGMLRSGDFEDTVIPDNLSKNVTSFKKSVRPVGNLSKFSVREVVQLFRQLGFREEVILCFSGNRIDGGACSLLTKADMKRYRMNEKEISLLQDYIQESKHSTQRVTSNIYEVS
uniref:Uncharacterized protein LOC100369137 n=1 Tax=Saccoglossus kowalevskii TaxID=10224 RepID=A0ABM0GTS4_SACKO|nr:PREDICTED: uncharacterized protein LOC100369137 [Saccoglossus kowalevskii]